MATAAQILANQLNAQASTGPRTAEGKSICAANATLPDSMLETGFNPMQNEANIKAPNPVDRTRGSAGNSSRRTTAAPRRLQTERQIARQIINKVESANREAGIIQPPDPSLTASCLEEYFAEPSQPVAA